MDIFIYIYMYIISIYLSIFLSIYRSIDRSIDLSIYRSIDLSIYLFPTNYPFILLESSPVSDVSTLAQAKWSFADRAAWDMGKVVLPVVLMGFIHVYCIDPKTLKLGVSTDELNIVEICWNIYIYITHPFEVFSLQHVIHPQNRLICASFWHLTHWWLPDLISGKPTQSERERERRKTY